MDLIDEIVGTGRTGHTFADRHREPARRCDGAPGRVAPFRPGSGGPDAEPETPEPFCRILGPIEIEIDGVAADLGGPRTRKVLAVLSTGAGAPIPDRELIEQVWGDRRPGNVTQALRTIVCRLRVVLGPSIGPRYLRRTRRGYALTIPVSLTDNGLLPALVVRAQQHLADDDPAAAAVDLESAVALWRGDPWQDLGDQPELTGARARLAELRSRP
jgi:DNA-binding winged helix-turn-helix (wHTH) protein